MTDDKDIVCRLRKTLYVLKKAPRTWYARLDKNLTKLGYSKDEMKKEFKMSMIEEMKYFLGL